LPHRCRLRPDGHDPHHASAARRTALNVNPNFSDGLYDGDLGNADYSRLPHSAGDRLDFILGVAATTTLRRHVEAL